MHSTALIEQRSGCDGAFARISSGLQWSMNQSRVQYVLNTSFLNPPMSTEVFCTVVVVVATMVQRRLRSRIARRHETETVTASQPSQNNLARHSSREPVLIAVPYAVASLPTSPIRESDRSRRRARTDTPPITCHAHPLAHLLRENHVSRVVSGFS